MAIVTDPDVLDRFEVIFGASAARPVVSIYPIQVAQQRGGVVYGQAFIANSSSIGHSNATLDWTAVSPAFANDDVIAIINGPNPGHYYAANVAANSIILNAVDSGVGGAATTGLTASSTSFDSTADVNDATEQVTITSHGYVTGDAVVATGGVPTGLTAGVTYFIIRIDTNTVSFASSYANALAGTAINLTDAVGTTTLYERSVMAGYPNGAATDERLIISGTEFTTAGNGLAGDLADGVTVQTVYSKAKDEWRTDSLNPGTYNDDLIRYQFPFEAITSEQFEIGGGTSHIDWVWFNEYSRKKTRTGGYEEKVANTGSQRLDIGVITLGALDADTQVYYQSSNTSVAAPETATPENFTFLGAVNESIQVARDDAANGGFNDLDNRTFLKLFARKKAKSYVQSTIGDIGVTSLQNIVNRFPLSHVDDSAIVLQDAALLAISPYRQTGAPTTGQLTSGTDGAVTSGGNTFTSVTDTFLADGVVRGDTLRITETPSTAGDAVNTGNTFYTIANVDSETVLQIKSDAEFTSWGASETNLDYEIYSYYRYQGTTSGLPVFRTTGTANTNAGNNFTDTSADFVTAGVANGDFVYIANADPVAGLYKVLNVANSTVLELDDSDQPFGTHAALDYVVLKPGMYLQYKKDVVDDDTTLSGVTQVVYTNSNSTITITNDTFNANSFVAGAIVEITGASNANNNGSFTVVSGDTTNLTLTGAALTDETDATPNSSINTFTGFVRTVNSIESAFNWRINAEVPGGAGATLSQIFQFIQFMLRQGGTSFDQIGAGAGDIDFGYNGGTVFRGDITDLLMSFSTPTGTMLNTYPDGLNSDDLNNVTYQDHAGVNRNDPFTASGSLVFNDNLVNDSGGKYWLFFTNDDAGDNLGRDYGTKDAIIVDNAAGTDIAGTISGSTVQFTYDYDGNIQRGSASASTDAPVTLVAIGLETAQFVIATGTITRTTGITISAVAALERNYLPGSV